MAAAPLVVTLSLVELAVMPLLMLAVAVTGVPAWPFVRILTRFPAKSDPDPVVIWARLSSAYCAAAVTDAFSRNFV